MLNLKAMARKIDPWLSVAATLYAANIIGWTVWALLSQLGD